MLNDVEKICLKKEEKMNSIPYRKFLKNWTQILFYLSRVRK